MRNYQSCPNRLVERLRYRSSKIIYLCPFPLLANLVCLKALILELLGDVFAHRLLSFQIGKILEPA